MYEDEDEDKDEELGRELPLLRRTPRSQWREVLRPLSERQRKLELNALRIGEEMDAGMVLCGELILEDGERREAARRALASLPDGSPPPRGAGRQLNIRLGHGEYERLRSAARMFGVRPSTLARMLVVRGVDAALREDQRVASAQRAEEDPTA